MRLSRDLFAACFQVGLCLWPDKLAVISYRMTLSVHLGLIFGRRSAHISMTGVQTQFVDI